MKPVVKFSGKKDVYGPGGTRDSAKGKLRYDLVMTPFAARAIARVMTAGADNHGELNWRKGIPFSRLKQSAERHWNQFLLGELDEDHLAHMAANILMMLDFKETGRTDLDDLPFYETDDQKLTKEMVQVALSNIKRDSEVQKIADDIGTGFTEFLRKKGKNGKAH